jgi:hypothetical protein
MGMHQCEVLASDDVTQFSCNPHVDPGVHRKVEDPWSLILSSVCESPRFHASECRFVSERRQMLAEQILDTFGTRVVFTIDDVHHSHGCLRRFARIGIRRSSLSGCTRGTRVWYFGGL